MEKMITDVKEPTPLQAALWVGLMSARYTRDDLLGILDELMDSLSDDFFILHYETNRTNHVLDQSSDCADLRRDPK